MVEPSQSIRALALTESRTIHGSDSEESLHREAPKNPCQYPNVVFTLSIFRCFIHTFRNLTSPRSRCSLIP